MRDAFLGCLLAIIVTICVVSVILYRAAAKEIAVDAVADARAFERAKADALRQAGVPAVRAVE